MLSGWVKGDKVGKYMYVGWQRHFVSEVRLGARNRTRHGACLIERSGRKLMRLHDSVFVVYL